MDGNYKLHEASDSGARRRQADTFGGSGSDADVGGESEPVTGSDLLGEQIRVLYGNARRSIWANYIALIAFVAVGYVDVPATILWSWTGCVAGLLLARYFIVVSRLKRSGFPEPAARLAFEYTIGTTLTGMTFAAGFLLFAPEVSDHQRSLMLVIIAGMCAGAVTSMASHRPAYHGYAFSLLLPAVGYAGVEFLQERTLTSATETCIIAAYTGVVLVIHTGIETFIRDNLRLQLEKARQVDRLEHVNVTLSRDRDAFHKASLTDGLTGIPNRRSFDQTLEVQWDRCMQRGSRLGCLLVDIDHFKNSMIITVMMPETAASFE